MLSIYLNIQNKLELGFPARGIFLKHSWNAQYDVKMVNAPLKDDIIVYTFSLYCNTIFNITKLRQILQLVNYY